MSSGGDDQLKFRARLEQIFRASPEKLPVETKELILREAKRIGVGKLTPASVEWVIEYLSRMAEKRERLDRIALSETLDVPAPLPSKPDATELVVLTAVHLAPRDEPVLAIGRKRGEPRFYLSQADWTFWGKHGRLPSVPT